MIAAMLGAGTFGFILGAVAMLAVILTLELIAHQLYKIFGSRPRKEKYATSFAGKVSRAADQSRALAVDAWRAVRRVALAGIDRVRSWLPGRRS